MEKNVKEEEYEKWNPIKYNYNGKWLDLMIWFWVFGGSASVSAGNYGVSDSFFRFCKLIKS